MKSERKILVAFLLNLTFSIFEFIGGTITGSVAIISDAIHDIGDAMSIGCSYFLEKKSKKQPDEVYTYGYARYSVLGSLITTIALLVGSALVIYNAILRIFNPIAIDYNGMIVFAIIGAIINFTAAWFTKDGDSLNQKAVNLHMIEDVFGWIVVLIGAIVMRFTNIAILDPVMSIGVALFILVGAIKNVKQTLNIFLEKAPNDIDVEEIKCHILEIDGVLDVHHIHIWSIDGCNNCATVHIVADADVSKIKSDVKRELNEHGIKHATLELENSSEGCAEEKCKISIVDRYARHHHHHNHHH